MREKYNVSPVIDITGFTSAYSELTTAPKLVGGNDCALLGELLITQKSNARQEVQRRF